MALDLKRRGEGSTPNPEMLYHQREIQAVLEKEVKSEQK